MTDDEKQYRALCADFRELMKDSKARKALWHILDLTGLNADCFTGDNQTFYLEGRRAVGLDIIRFMEDADKTMYPRMLLNHQKTQEGKDE